MADESKYPTIHDMHAVLTDMVAKGFGDMPAQLVVVPDSTMQALAKVVAGHDTESKAALMMDFLVNPDRMPVTIMSTARMGGSGAMPTTARQ